MIRLSRSLRAAGCLAALVLFTATDARAQGWQWNLTPYIWTTGVGVDVSLKGTTVVDETIAFTDLIEDLVAAVQLRVEGQKGAHGLMADLFFVGLAKEESRVQLPTGAFATAEAEMRMSIIDAAALYNPTGNQQGLTLYYGARIMVERAKLDATLESGPSSPVSFDVKDTLVDALIGARWNQRLSSHWSVAFRGDASTGATEFTWSAGADLAYAFGARDRFAVTAGYRQMVVEFKTPAQSEIAMTMSGFMGGFRIAF